MRKMAAVMVLGLLLCISARAGEMETYEFMKGLYTYDIPSGWVVEDDEMNIAAVKIRPRTPSTSMLIITTPNPYVGAELKNVTGAYVGFLFKGVGNGQVEEVKENMVIAEKYKGVMVTFNVQLSGEAGTGFAIGFDVNGYAVIMLAAGPSSDQEFIQNLSAILKSFVVDEELIEVYADELDEMGKDAFKNLSDMLKDE